MGLLSLFSAPSSLGQWGEGYVAKLYSKQGYELLGRNYFNRTGVRVGEIDVIARRDRMLVFIEVKTRTNTLFGTPAESVTLNKQRRLIRACRHYLSEHPEYADFSWRIDVAEVLADIDRKSPSVTILENAVEDTQ